MYVLDTDHLSLIQRNGEPGQRILAKIATVEKIQIAVTNSIETSCFKITIFDPGCIVIISKLTGNLTKN